MPASTFSLLILCEADFRTTFSIGIERLSSRPSTRRNAAFRVASRLVERCPLLPPFPPVRSKKLTYVHACNTYTAHELSSRQEIVVRLQIGLEHGRDGPVTRLGNSRTTFSILATALRPELSTPCTRLTTTCRLRFTLEALRDTTFDFGGHYFLRNSLTCEDCLVNTTPTR